jgi:uncharacterized protein
MRYLILAIIVMFTISANSQTPADSILLSNYRPVPLHKVPITKVERAAYPIIDVHSHPYASSIEEIDLWVENMDRMNVERTIILTYSVGARLDSLIAVYGKYPDRFEMWCGLDLQNPEDPNFTERVVKELERCHAVGGKGLGELSDKGWGLRSGTMTAHGVHPNDPKLAPVWKRAGELGLPINLHVADPIWMYEPMDESNDGLMTAWRWRLDNRDDIVGHAGMIQILEETIRNNPETTFIACHFANLSYDLEQLGVLLDQYPNFYADISARYSEIATIPRHAARFITKYQDRLLYGTDMGFNLNMYQTTLRILETEDEHFYEHSIFGYHWPLNGFGLENEVLQKIYRNNAIKILK